MRAKTMSKNYYDDEILFVDKISDKPLAAEEKTPAAKADNTGGITKGTTTDTEKKAVTIKHSKEDVTIAKLIGGKV